MIQILINNIEVPHSNNTAIPLTRRGAFSFIDQSNKDVVEHMDLPITPELKEALGYSHRLNSNARKKLFPFKIVYNGVIIFEGKCKVSSWNNNYVKIFAGTGKTLLLRDLSNKFLHEYYYHDPISFPDKAAFGAHITSLYSNNQPEDSWYTLFPVYVPKIAASITGVENGGHAFGQNNFSIYHQTGVFPPQFPRAVHPYRFVSVFYRLHKVLRAVLEAEGYTITENWFESIPDLKRITIYNNYDLTSQKDFNENSTPKYIEAAKCMPLISVKDFIRALEGFFNVTFNFDKAFFGEVSIIQNDEKLKTPPKIKIDDYVSRAYEREVVSGYNFSLAPKEDAGTTYGEILDSDGPFKRAEPEWPDSTYYIPASENQIVYVGENVEEETGKLSLYKYSYKKYTRKQGDPSNALALVDLLPGTITDEIGTLKMEGSSPLQVVAGLGIPTMHMTKYLVDYIGMEQYIEFNYVYMPKMDIDLYNPYADGFEEQVPNVGLFLIKEQGIQEIYWHDSSVMSSYAAYIPHGTTSFSGPIAFHFIPGGIGSTYTIDYYPSPRFALRWFNDEQAIGSGMFDRVYKNVRKIYSDSVRETVRGVFPADIINSLSQTETIRYAESTWIVEEIRRTLHPGRKIEVTEVDLIKL